MSEADVNSCPTYWEEGDCMEEIAEDGFDWIEKCNYWADVDCRDEIVSCWVELFWDGEWKEDGDCEEVRQKMNEMK